MLNNLSFKLPSKTKISVNNFLTDNLHLVQVLGQHEGSAAADEVARAETNALKGKAPLGLPWAGLQTVSNINPHTSETPLCVCSWFGLIPNLSIWVALMPFQRKNSLAAQQ